MKKSCVRDSTQIEEGWRRITCHHDIYSMTLYRVGHLLRIHLNKMGMVGDISFLFVAHSYMCIAICCNDPVTLLAC